jgi:hypothetical protein
MSRSVYAKSLGSGLIGLLALLTVLPALAESPDPNAELDAVEPPAPEGQSEGREEGGESQQEDDESEETADDAPDAPKRRPAGNIETANLEDPIFPEPSVRDAFRVRFQSRFMPSGNFDSFDADLYKPQLRLRATAPLTKWAALQLTTTLGTSRYDFDDVDILGSPARDTLSDFYEATIRLQAAARLNEGRSLFVKGETWSVLVAGDARSRWEPGAFVEALTGTGGVAFGYEIDDVIRIAVGVRVGSRIGRNSIGVGPIASLKWDVTDRFTVRSRGRGLQLEYTFNRQFEVFAAGFFDGDRFLLDQRPGLPDDTTFKDESILAGAGFEWKISKHFRVNVELGAVAWREMRVRSQRAGTLFKERAGPGAYFDVRFEARP